MLEKVSYRSHHKIWMLFDFHINQFCSTTIHYCTYLDCIVWVFLILPWILFFQQPVWHSRFWAPWYGLESQRGVSLYLLLLLLKSYYEKVHLISLLKLEWNNQQYCISFCYVLYVHPWLIQLTYYISDSNFHGSCAIFCLFVLVLENQFWLEKVFPGKYYYYSLSL